MSQISVISKLTGVETTSEGTQVTLSHTSIVELKVERANVADFARSGNDLVITLHSGEVITIKNFYVTDAQGASQLVLQDSEGALWWIQDPAGAATYESIASTDVLLAASGSDAGGAAIWPWVLGGIVAAGGIAAAASTGGGGGGDDDDDNGSNPGTPTNPSDPDTTPPNAPSGLQFSPDGKTISGTAEPGSTITLKDADGNVIGTGKTGSDGKFTIDLGTPLTNGEQITATATDPSGNTSPGTTVTAPDITVPDAPDILLVNDDVGSKAGPLENGERTDDPRPTFSGIGEPGSTITFYDNGKPIGTTQVDAKGSWSFTPTTDLANGSHTITTTATDAAGNTSPASAAVSFVVDTVAPGAPTITSATDDIDPGKGTVNSGGSTNDPRPQLSGTAEAGSTVTIYDGSVAIGTAVVSSNGTWSFTPPVNLGESAHQFTVRATDAAGNTGPASPVFTLTVDLTPPAAPTAIVLSDETGAIKGAIVTRAQSRSR
ncbi:Ig-like domain-containing protein [Enterobacter cloacae]|uniref:Ig-like domain-containing protein n=1 Tax=Enterobacter cloacae TaxID=550 RepID=UPI0002EEEA2C